MKPPAIKTHEIDSSTPVLIVDKIGVIGEALAIVLSHDYLVILLSPNAPPPGNEKIIHVPFKKNIPEAPDNRYSKIFIVDDGRSVTKQSAFSFITKARESSSPLFFIGSVRNVDIEHADEIASSYSNSKVLVFGDLFDKNIFFDKNEAINRYILQARKNGKIEVDGSGLAHSYPISFEDTIKLIIKASYLEIPQKIILLFYPHPITDISLANIFQKINPNIVVDFTKDARNRETYIPSGGQHAILEYKLEDKIRKLDLEDTENRELKVVRDDKNSRRSVAKPFLSLILICLFLILLPFITTSVYALLGQREIKSARISAERGDLAKARKQIDRSNTFFDIALKTGRALSYEAKVVGMKDASDKIENKIEAGKTLSQGALYLLDGVDFLSMTYSGESRDVKSDFLKASNSFKSAIGLIQKLKAEGSLSEEYSRELDNIEPFIDLFSSSSDILPEVLGFEGEKTYLVLLQDNTELRPGGGHIGSIAVLKVKNGRVTDLNVSPVSQIDDKLTASIDPPFALKRYLPLDSLTLEDSNFDPDFINNAITSSNIYSLSEKNKVDGVIGVDSIFIKNLISAIGPLTVSEMPQKIDEKNFDSLIFAWQNKVNELGEGDDFLGLVAISLKKHLEKNDKPYFALTQSVGKSVREKNLMFAHPTLAYQNIFTANNWSSSLWDNRQKEDNKINDYLGISEANLGGNNVNRFISRSVSKRISVSEKGNISSKLTIGFKNNSSSKDKDMDYKNYLQLILPEGSIIKAIAIDNKQVEIEKAIVDSAIFEAKNFKPPQGFEVDERNESDKTIFGFLLTVPSSQVKTLNIVYDLPYALPPVKKSTIYSLKLYKQPGIDSYPFDLTFELPEKYQALGGNSVSEEINSDKEISLTIAQK